MPFFDRFWWLRLTPAALVMTLGGGLAAKSISFQTSIYSSAGYFGPASIAFVAAVAITALLYLGLFGAMALRARRRKRLRRATRRGLRDAMPLARIVPDPAHAPNTAEAPLVLSWSSYVRAARRAAAASPHAVRARRRRFDVFTVLQLIMLALIALQFGRIFVSIFTLSPLSLGDKLLSLLQGTALAVLVVLPVGTLLVVWLALFTLGWMGLVALVRGKPFGVAATEDGIREMTAGGRSRFVSWHDACLLEVEVGRVGGSAGYHYYLFGSRNYIHWTDELNPPRSDAIPEGISREEMSRRQQALLDLVAARTGLVPRTATRALQPGGAAPVARRIWLTVGLSLLAGSLLVGCLAMAVMLVPLTGIFLFDAAVAGLLLLGALPTAGLAVPYLIGPRRGRSRRETSYVPPAASLGTPDGVYIARTGRSPIRRGAQFLATGAVTLAGILGYLPVGLPYMLPQVPSPFPRPSFDNAWQSSLPMMLLLTAAISGIFLFALFAFRSVIVRADERGVIVRYGVVATAATWDGIERVVVQVRDSRPLTYSLLGPNRKPVVGWFAYALQRPRLQAGEIAVTPDELAAIVAQRTGKQIEVVAAGDEYSWTSGMSG